MGLWIGIAVLVLFVLYFLNKTALHHVKDAAGAQVGKFGKKLWGYDPIAVKNAEINRKTNDVNEATKAIIGVKKLISQVERQIKSEEKELADLQSLAEQYAKEGKDDLAVDKLTQIERVEEDLKTNREQLKTHRETLQNWLIKSKNAAKRLAEYRQETRSQEARLEMSKAEAALVDLAPAIGKTKFNLDKMSEIDSEIESQIDENRAKAEVIHELTHDEDDDARERARKASAAKKLSALKDKMGVK